MITARAYINPITEKLTADMYLGNDKDRPIFMAEFEKAFVNYDKDSKTLLLRLSLKDAVTLIRFDRLYIDKKLPSDSVMTSNEIGNNPQIMSKIHTLTIQSD